MRPFALCIGIILSISAFAEEESVKPPPAYGDHYGYLFDVKEERNKRYIEMVMLERPKEPSKPKAAIVSEKLTKEFQAQYKYRFGETQAEQTLNSVGRQDGYTYFTGQTVTLKQYQKDQRLFAEYMGRKLTEYHVDNWIKNDPDMRPVYELKDKVSNVNVKFDNGYKFEWRYNFAGPNMEAKLKNPYEIDFKVRLDMTGIISNPKETVFTFGYQFTPRVYASWVEKQWDAITQLVISRRMTPHISTYVTTLIDRSDAGLSAKQELYLIGFSWSD